MKESDIEGYLVKCAAKLGGLAVKHVSPGRAGDPDRLVAIPQHCPTCGRQATVGLIELKDHGEVPRPLQLVRMREWQRVGVPVAWAGSKAGVDAALAALASGRVVR